MDKNSITGLILIAAIMFGFTFIQSRKATRQQEIQYQLDSAYRAEHPEEFLPDTAAVSAASATIGESDGINAEVTSGKAAPASAIYKDSLLEAAHYAESGTVTLSNDKLDMVFTTRGAKPYSVVVKDYLTYDSTALNIFNPGSCEYSIRLYISEYINTKDFTFNVVSNGNGVLVMRLPLACGGFIEQKYELEEGSYMVRNTLSLVGLENAIPRNVSSFDIDYSMIIPRMEKGYKNESQYSKVDFYYDGEKKPVEIGKSRDGAKRIDSSLSWFAFQQQFFSSIVRSEQQFNSGEISVSYFGQDDPDKSLMFCSANMREDLDRSDPTRIVMNFDMYYGPNHYRTLKSFDRKYEKIIPLGGSLVGWFTKYAIIPMFNFFHKFISNFGLIILLMTIVIKVLVLPFTWKSYSSSAKMQALKPEMERINAKYPKQEDAMKKQQATMDLYKKAGVSPMGGCLPMLLTMPILWAMFRFFPASIELRQQPFLWCKDLSAYDSIIDFGTKVPLIGDHLSLFALLMAVTMFFYSKMTTAGQTASNDPNAASMRFMSVWMMPIMMFFICNSLSAALSYYYLLSNLITMLQTFIIKKFTVNPDEILEKVRKAPATPSKKSKWQMRLEEAQKMQRAQLEAQQKKQRR